MAFRGVPEEVLNGRLPKNPTLNARSITRVSETAAEGEAGKKTKGGCENPPKYRILFVLSYFNRSVGLRGVPRGSGGFRGKF